MARVSVSVPDELVALVREQLPGLNLSGVLQDGLRAKLGCDHRDLECARCRAKLELYAVALDALTRFYRAATWELDPLIRRGGTAEGAARVFKRVAECHGIEEAARLPLPRPSAAERRAAKVKDLRSA